VISCREYSSLELYNSMRQFQKTDMMDDFMINVGRNEMKVVGYIG